MGFFGKKVPEPGPGVYRAHLLSYRDYPRDKDAPVLPSPLPVPYCDCGQPAEVQQSRDARTAGRAFYMCGTIEVDGEWPIKKCGFFKWIDGPDKYDPRIRLFPWRSHVTTPYHQFNRWVPPPPNPPEMTEEEKKEATDRRIMNPPFCHCGTPGRIIRPNPGVEFTPFFRCPLKRSAHWPTCEEIEEFTSGKKKWPCKSYPPKICKCGILARKGVVPSELAYGWYCGNSYGDFWEGRGCDYEYWEGQKEWITEVERCPDRKVRAYEERRREIRAKYGVLVPREEDWGKIREDMGAPRGIVHVDFETRMLRYWRNHRSRYAPPLPYGQQKRERAEERTKKIEREREEYRRRMSSSDDIDINATYPEGSWQECIQRIRRRKRAAAVEMETMRALVRNLPRVDPDGGNLGGDDGQA